MPHPNGKLELSDEMRARKLPQVPKNTQAVSRKQNDANQEQTRTSQQQDFLAQQAYLAHLMRAQLAQMRMAEPQQSQPPQGEMLRNSPQMMTQRRQEEKRRIAQTKAQKQQQMLMVAARGQTSRNMQSMNMGPRFDTTWRYVKIYQQRLFRLKHNTLVRLLSQYGAPTDWPPQVAQEYTVGLEQAAKAITEDVMREDRAEIEAAWQLIMLRQGSVKK
jgi:transcription factor SPT20